LIIARPLAETRLIVAGPIAEAPITVARSIAEAPLAVARPIAEVPLTIAGSIAEVRAVARRTAAKAAASLALLASKRAFVIARSRPLALPFAGAIAKIASVLLRPIAPRPPIVARRLAKPSAVVITPRPLTLIERVPVAIRRARARRLQPIAVRSRRCTVAILAAPSLWRLVDLIAQRIPVRRRKRLGIRRPPLVARADVVLEMLPLGFLRVLVFLPRIAMLAPRAPAAIARWFG
jgi:hypothetical protein